MKKLMKIEFFLLINIILNVKINVYIDIGNTSVDVAVIKNDFFRRYKILNSDERLEKKLEKLFDDDKTTYFAYISSVNRKISCKVINVLDKLNINYYSLNTKIMLDYCKENGYEISNIDILGQDLFLDLIAFEEDSIIIDLGTASKILYLDKEKRFVGGMIFPNVLLAPKILSSSTDLISENHIDFSPSLLSLNTKEAISSGAINGSSFIIYQSILQIKNDYSKDAKVIFTGGYFSFLEKKIQSLNMGSYIVSSNLVIAGLAKIFNPTDFIYLKK